MSTEQRLDMREAARRLFVHGYDSYMRYGYPMGELRPLSCGGVSFESSRVPAVSLIDALDTLVVLGNHSEFRRAVRLVSKALPNGFDLDGAERPLHLSPC